MAWREAAAGSAAGVIGTAVGYPFDVVKTRLQAQPERFNAGMLRAFRTIAREEGATAFFLGFVPPLCALTLLNTMNFGSYATMRSRLGVADGPLRGPDARVVVAGAAAGPIASLVSTPFEYIKIQLQLDNDPKHKRYRSSAHCCYKIARTSGVLAVFRGHYVNTAREMIFLGAYFGVYEHTKSLVAAAVPGWAAVAVSGGVSGAFGWLISQPLDTVKANVQRVTPDLAVSTRQVARSVFRTRGFLGFFAGAAPAVSRAFLVSSTRFTVYEGVHDRLRRHTPPA